MGKILLAKFVATLMLIAVPTTFAATHVNANPNTESIPGVLFYGKVKNSQTGAPIKGVQVAAYTNDAHYLIGLVKTDEFGRYEIRDNNLEVPKVMLVDLANPGAQAVPKEIDSLSKFQGNKKLKTKDVQKKLGKYGKNLSKEQLLFVTDAIKNNKFREPWMIEVPRTSMATIIEEGVKINFAKNDPYFRETYSEDYRGASIETKIISGTSQKFDVSMKSITTSEPDENAALYGFVTDAKTGKPLPNFVVSFLLGGGGDGTQVHTKTNKDGFYQVLRSEVVKPNELKRYLVIYDSKMFSTYEEIRTYINIDTNNSTEYSYKLKKN